MAAFSWKSLAVAFAIAALSVLLIVFTSRTLVFNDINHWTYDFLVNHDHAFKADPNIVVVDFDDDTFAALKQFPTPRSIVAQVLTKVSAGSPRVIGLDFLLSEPRSPAEDAIMRSALSAAGNVIIASQSGSGGLPAVEPLAQFCLPDPASYGSCREGAVGFGLINFPIDSDGFIRRFLLFSADSHSSQSFPLLIAEAFQNSALVASRSSASFNGHTVPYAETNLHSVLIGSWSSSPARSIPAIKVLRDEFDAGSLRDKVVLIGQGSDAARDREFTPVFRSGTANGVRLRLPGTQVHAAAISTLLNGTAVRPAPIGILLTISFFITACVAALLLTREPKYSLLLTALTAILCYAVAQLLFNEVHVWFQFFATELCIAVAVPLTLTYQFIQERFLKSEAVEQREQVMGLLSRYVAPDVAREIWKRRKELFLAGEERMATVLFSDIRSFTALTAGKPSQAVLSWLNNYLTAMDEVISIEAGFLNKFIGDGLMVLFGVPLSHGVEEDAIRAVRCAVRMHQRVQELNAAHVGERDYAAIKIGVGVHTGLLTCGSVGSSNRLEYSVIGETVNLASRLESLTKDFKTDIVLSRSTWEYIKDSFPDTEDLGAVKVRGFDEPLPLYGLRVNVKSTETRHPVSVRS
jgi:adenylate cyclase